jgi:hypothetical protein
MPALLKTTQIQEPSSATVNMTLDTSGGMTVGQNLTVTGTTTFTGGSANVKLNGSSSGTTTVQAAAVASGTVTIPAGTGTAAVQGVSTNIVSGTAVASTSGTAITFTGIPSWVKRITVMLQGVATSSTSPKLVQLGTVSGFVTTGYLGSGSSGASAQNYTTGFGLFTGASTNIVHGNLVLTNLTSNTWTASGSLGLSDAATPMVTGGSISAANLGGVLTQVRVTTVNGTDTFTAGNINIMYE